MATPSDIVTELRSVRSAHRSTAFWLGYLLIVLVPLRVVLADRLAGVDGSLSLDQLYRLHALDAGICLIGLAVVLLTVGGRFGRALQSAVLRTELANAAVDEERRSMAARMSRADLVYRLAVGLQVRLDEAARDDRGLAGARAASRRLLDVMAPLQPGFTVRLDPFDVREVLASISSVSAGARTVGVTSLVRDEVPGSLRGDPELLARAVTRLGELVAERTGCDTVLLSARSRGGAGAMTLEFEVRDAKASFERESEASIETSDEVREVAAMAAGMGGTLHLGRRTDGSPRFVLTCTVLQGPPRQVDATGDWDPVARKERIRRLADRAAVVASDEVPAAAPAPERVSAPRPSAPNDPLRTPAPSPRPASVAAVTEGGDGAPRLASPARATTGREPAPQQSPADAEPASGGPPAARGPGAVSRRPDSQVVGVVVEDEDAVDAATLFSMPGQGAIPGPARVQRTTGSTPVASAAPPGAPQPQTRSSSPRVLLAVEDSETRWALTGQLAALGVQVDAAPSGAHALRALDAGRRYSALLLATDLPGTNGFQIAARVRQRPGPERATPIIALSALAGPDERRRCAAVDIDALLELPVDPDALAIAFARHVGDVAGAEPAAGDAVDLGVLERLEAIAGASEQPDLVRRTVASFIGRTEDAFRAFELAFVEADSTLAHVTADRLRRSCAALGVRNMEALAERIARVAEAGDVEPTREMVRSLEREFERVRPFLLDRA